MALVKVTRIGGPNGAICRIWDDMVTPMPKEQAEAMRGEVVYRMLMNQLERGITPTFHKLDVPTDIEILYDRDKSVEDKSQEYLPEKPEGGAG